VILLDPEGYAVWGTSGEITFKQVDKVIRRGNALLSTKETAGRNALAIRHGTALGRPTPLAFPANPRR